MVAVVIVAVAVDVPSLRAQPVAQKEREAVRMAIEQEDTPALRDALAALARTTWVDAAAEAFVQAIEALPRNRQFRARFEAALGPGDTAPPERSEGRWLFVLVPGLLYITDPETGADLSRVQSVLGSLGLASRLVPLEENGTIETNAAYSRTRSQHSKWMAAG